MLKSLKLSVLLWACTSPGVQIAFSPVLESVWHRRCPESKIRVRETRRHESRTTYVLDACGAIFEVQERVSLNLEPSMSPEQVKSLAASLERGPVPESIRAKAQSFAPHPCDPETTARECIDSDVEILGSDSDDDGVRRWWIRAGDRIGLARFYWSKPLCGEHKYGPRPTCDL